MWNLFYYWCYTINNKKQAKKLVYILYPEVNKTNIKTIEIFNEYK